MSETLFSNESEEVVETTVETTETNVETTETVVDETASTTWSDGLEVDEEYGDIIKSYDDPNKLFKEFVNQKSLIGKKGVLKPGEGASDEEIAKYYTELGKPETADAYDLGITDETPEWVAGIAEEFKEFAHESNIPQDMAKPLFDKYAEHQQNMVNERVDAMKVAKEDCINDLKTEYGSDFERQVGLANTIASEYGIVDVLATSELGNSPEIVKMLAEFASLKGKSSPTPRVESGAGSIGSINDQLAELRANDHYFDNTDQGLALRAKATKLTEQRMKLRK